MKKAETIAKAFLCLNQPEVGDGISNLKLQKLLYYAQGFSMAAYGEPLFKEDVVAWEHGPVVVEVYEKYKKNGSNYIPSDTCPASLTTDEKNLIQSIWNVYGQFSAWKLRDMTHNEIPWLNTKRNQIIPQERMVSYFKDLVVSK